MRLPSFAMYNVWQNNIIYILVNSSFWHGTSPIKKQWRRTPNTMVVAGLNPWRCIEIWASLFTQHCPRLSEETLRAVGPFYLMSMSVEVKDHTQGVNVLSVMDA